MEAVPFFLNGVIVQFCRANCEAAVPSRMPGFEEGPNLVRGKGTFCWEKCAPAVCLLADAKNPISSPELGGSLGVIRRAAWFVLRILGATPIGTLGRMSSTTEAGCTFHRFWRGSRSFAFSTQPTSFWKSGSRVAFPRSLQGG